MRSPPGAPVGLCTDPTTCRAGAAAGKPRLNGRGAPSSRSAFLEVDHLIPPGVQVVRKAVHQGGSAFLEVDHLIQDGRSDAGRLRRAAHLYTRGGGGSW